MKIYLLIGKPLWKKMAFFNSKEYLRVIKNSRKKLSRKLKGFYLYEQTSGELENVFVEEQTGKVVFWSGELIVQTNDDLIDELDNISGVEVVKGIGDFIILKINNVAIIMEAWRL